MTYQSTRPNSIDANDPAILPIAQKPSPYDVDKFDPSLLGKGWDDITVGETYSDFPNRSVRITEEAVNQFAQMTGDFNPIHLDARFARQSIHRGKIAHGALLMSYVIGQYHGSGFTYGTTLAMLNCRTTFLRACPVGDTTFVNFVVESKEEIPHAKRGIVSFQSWLRNVESHEAYMELRFDVLVRRLRGKSALQRLGVSECQVIRES